MKNKGLLKNVLGLALFLVFSLFISSCGEDPKPIPTIKVVVNSVDGFKVDIAAEATNATSWSWDYGDGNVSDTIGGHFYTYTERGDFTITCTVTGEGGSAKTSVDVHIASKKEMLTAHTWVLSEAGGNACGMGFHITKDLILSYTVPDILGTVITQQTDDEKAEYDFLNEYNDEFTFNTDGSYSVDYKNNTVLTSWVYADQGIYKGACSFIGIYAISIPVLTDAAWTLHENEDLTFNTVYDATLSGVSGGVQESVTFTNADFLTFTNDGFLGLKDYSSTVLLRSISGDNMEVTIFFHGYNDGTLGGDKEPSYFLNFTFKPKA